MNTIFGMISVVVLAVARPPIASIPGKNAMDELYEYFRGEYQADKRDVHATDRVLSEAWQTFFDCFDGRGWPYELETGTSPQVTEVNGVSFSTSAMILFAIGFASGSIQESELLPAIRIDFEDEDESKEEGLIKNLRSVVVPAIEHIVHVSNYRSAQFNGTFHSGSFGLDDPFTHTWFFEVLVAAARDDKDLLAKWKANGELKFADFFTRLCASAATILQRPMTEKCCLDFTDPKKAASKAAPKAVALDHSFPLLRIVQLDRVLARHEAALREIDTDAFAQLDESRRAFAANRPVLREALLARIHRHLSYDKIRDAPFDAAELVFSLEGVLLCDPHPTLFDRELINQVFSVVEERQKRNPYWRPLKPFVTTAQGFALLPLSVEIGNSLLRICKRIEERGQTRSRFTQYVPLFKRYTEWVRERHTRGTTTDGSPFVGWHSEHVHVPGKVHPWETSQVVLYLTHYRAMLQEHIARESQRAANFSVRYLKRKESLREQNALDYWVERPQIKEPVPSSSAGSIYRVYEGIKERIIKPRVGATVRKDVNCSILLYGPPGTGKTGLAEDIAEALDWPLIEITPSDFVAEGEAEVEMRAKYIFQALGEQQDVVVLFDEIDRLILDRDSKLYQQQSDMFQFMTPGMLPKLKTLRSLARVIFVIGTNYEERIDPAAVRVGRVDERLLVGPSDLKQRQDILFSGIDAAMKKAHLAPDPIDAGTEKKKLVERLGVTKEDLKQLALETVLCSFGELVQLVKTAVTEAKQGATLEKSKLLASLTTAWNKQRPANLRIAQYKSRFRVTADKGNNFPTEREPTEEFLLIVYLLSEADAKLTEADADTVAKILQGGVPVDLQLHGRSPKTSELLSAIMNHLKDHSMCQAIVDKAIWKTAGRSK